MNSFNAVIRHFLEKAFLSAMPLKNNPVFKKRKEKKAELLCKL